MDAICRRRLRAPYHFSAGVAFHSELGALRGDRGGGEFKDSDPLKPFQEL